MAAVSHTKRAVRERREHEYQAKRETTTLHPGTLAPRRPSRSVQVGAWSLATGAVVLAAALGLETVPPDPTFALAAPSLEPVPLRELPPEQPAVVEPSAPEPSVTRRPELPVELPRPVSGPSRIVWVGETRPLPKAEPAPERVVFRERKRVAEPERDDDEPKREHRRGSRDHRDDDRDRPRWKRGDRDDEREGRRDREDRDEQDDRDTGGPGRDRSGDGDGRDGQGEGRGEEQGDGDGRDGGGRDD